MIVADFRFYTQYIHFHPVHLKYTHVSKLPDLVRVQQLHSSCAFVEVVSERDAAKPVLDFAVAHPHTDVDGFGFFLRVLTYKLW